MPLDGVVEMANYFGALDHGLARLHQGFPLSNRLIREIHEVLLSRGRGGSKAPGGSRPGNAAFVPPPPLLVPDCMAALERFLHAEGVGLPVLVRAGLAHVQFETIHPFLGGNGRVGRLLITLLLCHSGVLREPLLYLSLYSAPGAIVRKPPCSARGRPSGGAYHAPPRSVRDSNPHRVRATRKAGADSTGLPAPSR